MSLKVLHLSAASSHGQAEGAAHTTDSYYRAQKLGPRRLRIYR
jgi:hypothetical protein